MSDEIEIGGIRMTREFIAANMIDKKWYDALSDEDKAKLAALGYVPPTKHYPRVRV